MSPSTTEREEAGGGAGLAVAAAEVVDVGVGDDGGECGDGEDGDGRQYADEAVTCHWLLLGDGGFRP